MRLMLVFLLTLSFGLTGCSYFSKKDDKPAKKSKKVAKIEGQLPDHDYKIHQPLETEIMIMIDSRGRAKEIPNEWDVDTSGHMAYSTNKPVKVSKKKRSVASKKKKKRKSKKKKRKSKKRKKKKR